MPDEVKSPEPPKDNAAGATPPAGATQGAPAPAAPAAADDGPWPPAGEITKDDKTMALLAWLLLIVSGFVGPLVIFIIKKDQSKFVAFHALQALWFGVAVTAAMFVSVLLVLCYIGLALAPLVGMGALAVAIIWGLKANKGEWAELPVVGGWARKGL